MRIWKSFIQTGLLGKPFENRTAGDIDAALMLLFVAAFQIFIGLSLHRIFRASQDSLQKLADIDEDLTEEIEVFGAHFAPPLPRIDYGAYHQKNRDAEALCLVALKSSFESELIELHCN